MLNTKLAATRSKAYKLYLVKWERLYNSYKSWIIEAELLKHNQEVTTDDLEPWGSKILKEEEDDAEHRILNITTVSIHDWREHTEFK